MLAINQLSPLVGQWFGVNSVLEPHVFVKSHEFLGAFATRVVLDLIYVWISNLINCLIKFVIELKQESGWAVLHPVTVSILLLWCLGSVGVLQLMSLVSSVLQLLHFFLGGLLSESLDPGSINRTLRWGF